MSEIALNQIIEQLKSKTLQESNNVELKPTLPRQEILATLMVAMANNNDGGLIVLGVSETCTVVGLGNEASEGLSSYVEKTSFELTSNVKYKIHKHLIDGKDVAFIEVFPSKSDAYFTRNITSPERRKIFYRKDGNLVKADELLYKKLFKYMRLETFVESLNKGSLRFVEPTLWEDQFEKRFYLANYNFHNIEENASPKLYATCFTKRQNSAAAWRVYSYGNMMGSHCVQLELDVSELRKKFTSSSYEIHEKKIKYMSEQDIRNIHKKTSPQYNEYFSPFNLQNFINLLSIKRDAYDFEEEVRIFAIPKPYENRKPQKRKADFYDMPISWKDVISKIRVDDNCSSSELYSLQIALLMAGIKPKLKMIKDILPDKKILHSFKFSKEIDVVSFNVNKMPKRIHINIPG